MHDMPMRRAGPGKQDVHVQALSNLDQRFKAETHLHHEYFHQQQCERGSHFTEALVSDYGLWAQALVHMEVSRGLLPVRGFASCVAMAECAKHDNDLWTVVRHSFSFKAISFRLQAPCLMLCVLDRKSLSSHQKSPLTYD